MCVVSSSEAAYKLPEFFCNLFVCVCHLLPSKLNYMQDEPLTLRNGVELLHLSTCLRKAMYIDFIF